MPYTPAHNEFLSAFKRKAIPGLYSFDHFEREDGSWIQMSVRRDSFVFLDGKTKEMSTFNSLLDLLTHAMS